MDTKMVEEEKQKGKSAIKEAIEYGIDVTLLYESLSFTPTERIKRHDKFLEEIEELRRAGKRKTCLISKKY